MLQLRPNCECCDRNLPSESTEAVICTFECTFCSDGVLDHVCPNCGGERVRCGGERVRRPVRPAGMLAGFPASTERIFKLEGCR